MEGSNNYLGRYSREKDIKDVFDVVLFGSSPPSWDKQALPATQREVKRGQTKLTLHVGLGRREMRDLNKTTAKNGLLLLPLRIQVCREYLMYYRRPGYLVVM